MVPQKSSIRKIAAFILCTAPHLAMAAPFCVQVTGINPQCIYDDAAECRLRAQQLHGVCAANPDELRLVTGSTRYCMVSGDRSALCVYPDRQTCEQDATRHGQAACVDNLPKNQPNDMFRTDPERRY